MDPEKDILVYMKIAFLVNPFLKQYTTENLLSYILFYSPLSPVILVAPNYSHKQGENIHMKWAVK